jgi:hypothetical protein
MQNKPNLLNTQMNVSNCLIEVYENERHCSREKNKPNQTQTNSKRVGWGLACGELACTEQGRSVEPYPTNSSEKSLHFQDGFDNL